MNDETNKPKLGKLAKGFPMRDIWPNETDFSAWLAEADGLVLLGETLEMDLDEAETEKQVGPFAADVVCRGVGGVVVVENQFGRTDHDHLGKLLTYSAGLESATIVWIAETFVTQHRAALDWLNAQTVQEVRFFGLEIGLCKIEGSPLAPQFRIVSQPNDWTRSGGGSVKGQRAVSSWDNLCAEYWGEFLNFLKEEGTDLPIKNLAAPPRSWLVIGIGKARFWLEPAINQGGEIRAALALPGWAFAPLREDQAAVEEDTGVKWEWQSPNSAGKEARIRLFGDSSYDLADRSQWREQHQWLKKHLELLDKAFRPRIQNLEKPGE